MPTPAARAPVVVTARALPKGLPMGDVIYVTQPSGARFKACACIRDSWPTINKLARLKGYIRQQIDVTQGSYSTSVNASALTHAGGGVLDVMVTGAKLDTLLEECGIAAYERTEADGFSPHSHILWIGCPHLHDQAAAQVTSWRNLRNGLRSNTLDRDKTRPSPIRNWEQGLAWATAQLAQLEDDMAMTPTERAALVADIAEATRAKVFEQRMTGPGIDPDQRPTMHDYLVRDLPARTAAAVHGQWLGSSGPTIGTAVQGTYGLVRELAERAGVDIDEAALAAAVVSEVAPQLIAAIVAKLDGISGVDPAALAAEIVAELGSKLAA